MDLKNVLIEKQSKYKTKAGVYHHKGQLCSGIAAPYVILGFF